MNMEVIQLNRYFYINLWLVGGLGLALVMIIVGIRKSTAKTAKSLRIAKANKIASTNGLLDILGTLKEFNNKLINELTVLELFNIGTVKNALRYLQCTNDIADSNGKTGNKLIEDNFTFFINGQINMLNDIATMESEHYESQREYQKQLLTYNRTNTTDLDDIQREVYKKELNATLEEARVTIYQNKQLVGLKRHEFDKELKNSNELIDKLTSQIADYKTSTLSKKHFSFRYLTRI